VARVLGACDRGEPAVSRAEFLAWLTVTHVAALALGMLIGVGL
jgi:hypothetical protein